MSQDTVTSLGVPIPPVPRGADPNRFTEDVEKIVTDHIKHYDEHRQIEDAKREAATLRQKWMTYGIGGVVGLASGVTATLVVQRIKRGRMAK